MASSKNLSFFTLCFLILLEKVYGQNTTTIAPTTTTTTVATMPCPSGKFNYDTNSGNCYLFVNSPANFLTLQTACAIYPNSTVWAPRSSSDYGYFNASQTGGTVGQTNPIWIGVTYNVNATAYLYLDTTTVQSGDYCDPSGSSWSNGAPDTNVQAMGSTNSTGYTSEQTTICVQMYYSQTASAAVIELVSCNANFSAVCVAPSAAYTTTTVKSTTRTVVYVKTTTTMSEQDYVLHSFLQNDACKLTTFKWLMVSITGLVMALSFWRG